MKKLIQKTIMSEVVRAVACNKCGKETENTEEYNPEFHNYQSFEITFGYGSEFDGLELDFDLCDACMVELIKSLKIPPMAFGRLM